MAFDELGFCPRGEGGPFVSDGKLEWPGCSLPLNTSGGNLSEDYIHGMQNTIEAVRQLRGTARCQVQGAEMALFPVRSPSTMRRTSGKVVIGKSC